MERRIEFDTSILFLEFFVREYKFLGKSTVRTTLPKGAFFYTGKSKAIGYENKYERLLGFEDNTPYLSNNISDELFNKLIKKNTNIVASISGETVDQKGNWLRVENRLVSNKTHLNGNEGQFPYHNFKSISPYNFNILDINVDQSVNTNFPRKEITLNIQKGETKCFLCRSEEFSFGDYYYPNVNLVLFVKNYGLFDYIDLIPQENIDRMDNNLLCDQNFNTLDFRKSSLRYELG